MKPLATMIAICLIACRPCIASEPLTLSKPTFHTGPSDASAAVPLDDKLFIAASDEDSTLRIYSTTSGGPPLQKSELAAFLEVAGDDPETDIEGAARIGGRIYWISSHAASPKGKTRPDNHRFFATDLHQTEGSYKVVPAGTPYKNLLRDLASEPSLSEFQLAAAGIRKPKGKRGLSIEGLCATPEKHLLIGFRNPIPGGKALIIPLLNPHDVVLGKSARFAPPIRLDLGGLGIRAMARMGNGYLLAGGPFDGRGHSKLFKWNGHQATPELLKVPGLSELNPEALLFYERAGSPEIQLLSDDSHRESDARRSAGLEKQFRAFWIKR